MPEKKKRGRPKKAAPVQTEPMKEKTTVVLVDKAKMERARTDLNPMPFNVFDAAQSLMQGELQHYEDGSRLIKDTIKRVYKNYMGIYDEPYDPYTNRKKIFTPLTHNVVDAISKPVKIDARSIRITPLTNESRGKARLLNKILPYFFQQMGLEELMDQFTHRLAWFGGQVTVQDWYYEEFEQGKDKEPTTQVLKGFAPEEKKDQSVEDVKIDRPRVRLVDVMDIFTPATADSLPWAVRNASVILRSTQPLADVQGNPAYDDTAKAKLTGWTTEFEGDYDSSALIKIATAAHTSNSTSKAYGYSEGENGGSTMITLYERYGRFPKSWVTGKEEDALINISGIVTAASNTGDGSDLVVLSVRFSPFGDYGPFEEAHYNKLPNRWMGEGVAERLIPLQVWHNEIVNNRRNNELLIQHRQFVYRKGSVDPSQLYTRPGGGIPVENIGDIQWLPTPSVDNSSFSEDAAIESSAQRLAGIAQTPVQKKLTATESQLIQANQNLTFNEMRDTIEKYLERLVLKHLIPLLKRFFSGKKTIPIEFTLTELQMLDTYSGYEPFATEMIGKERFLLIDDKSIFDGEFAVTVDIDALPQSRQAQAQVLTNLMAMGAKIQNSGINIPKAMRKIAELNGIVDDRLFEDAQTAAPTGVTNAPPVSQEAPILGQQLAPQPQAPAV